MGILSLIKKQTRIFWIFLAAIAFFSIAALAFAQFDSGGTTTNPGGTSTNPTTALPLGTIRGWAWMGTGIQNQTSSEGGGGWLRFSCHPDLCALNTWGVQANLNEGSSQYGYLSGQAWSNNYGWLDFSYDNVESCWVANPAETFEGPAKILFPSGKVVGWAKFVAGDDIVTDGWDGCVSFSGAEYGTFVDTQSGEVSGWAWGSDVVGWISFRNPECPFCDVSVVLDEVIGCMDPNATNYNPLATAPGRCEYSNPEIVIGCMDPAALNYDPSANSPGRCEYGPGGPPGGPGGTRPRLSLNVDPSVFVIGQPNVGNEFRTTDVSWTSNAPSLIVPNSCSGSFSINGLTSTNLPGWTGPRANPNATLPASLNLTNLMQNASDGDFFRFTISCQTTDMTAALITASDTIVVDEITPPQVDSALDLRIISPESQLSPGPSFEIINEAGANVTLGWTGTEIDWPTCVGTSDQYDVNASPIGSYGGWDGLAGFTGIGSLLVPMFPPDNVTTVYRLQCQDTAGETLTDSVLVCVAGAACPRSGGGFPGYEEF